MPQVWSIEEIIVTGGRSFLVRGLSGTAAVTTVTCDPLTKRYECTYDFI